VTDPRAGAERAIRHTWRVEVQPAELATATRLLAGLPRVAAVPPAHRLAAAGRELVYQQSYLARLRDMVTRRELRQGSPAEDALFDDVLRGVGELVGTIEGLYGHFPERGRPGAESGLRATFLVEIADDRVDDALWIAEVARQASVAPEPPEPVARMLLRAVGDDLREVDRCLGELASGLEPGDLRDVAVETHTGCRELADAIAAGLPPVGEPFQRTSATESQRPIESAEAPAGRIER
jgi:hypothetical protein